MEILIRGDYLVFCIGNIISDAAIALFAFYIWYSQRIEKKIRLYIDLLDLNETDFLTLITALTLANRTYLAKVDLSSNDKNQLLKYFDSIDRLKFVFHALLILFAFGVVIQILAISFGINSQFFCDRV